MIGDWQARDCVLSDLPPYWTKLARELRDFTSDKVKAYVCTNYRELYLAVSRWLSPHPNKLFRAETGTKCRRRSLSSFVLKNRTKRTSLSCRPGEKRGRCGTRVRKTRVLRAHSITDTPSYDHDVARQNACFPSLGVTQSHTDRVTNRIEK